MTQRVIVGTLAVLAGIWLIKDSSKDFAWVKYTPHSDDEVERRKRDNVPLSMKMSDERTLEYTPEAQDRLLKLVEEKQTESK